MLILTRLPRESIQIADDILITYLGIKHGQAVIGIEAPPTINIARTELLERASRKAEQNPE
ncbi:MAG: carbon storage regulator [Candidatus Thiodiazotropha sp.]